MPIDIEALLQPVSGDQPCGVDLRHQPVYLQIREARRQEDELSQGVWKHDVKTADYPLVLKLSKEALTKRGKDLQVAAWLTEALLRLEGFSGFDQGLRLIRQLLETYWETVHPLMDDDGDLELRATPLRWVASQLDAGVRSAPLTKAGHSWYQYKQSRAIPNEDAARMDQNKQLARDEAIAEGQITPEDFEAGFNATPPGFSKQIHDQLAGLLALLPEMAAFCDEKFGEESPDFSPLRNTLEEVHQTSRILMKQKGVTEDEPVQEAQDEGWAEPASTETEYAEPQSYGYAQPTQAAAAPAPRRGGGGMEPSSADDAIERIIVAARYLRKENPSSPAGYMLPRYLRWSELRACGGYPDPNLLQPPSSDVRVSLKRLANEGNWDQISEMAENAAGQPCGRAWLDLHRYACTAALFAGQSAISNAIVGGLKSLLADVPHLLDWSLADDTPVANAETIQWLRDQGALTPPASQGESFEAAAPPSPPPPPPPPPPQVWYPPPEAVAPTSASGEGEPTPPDAYDLAMEAARNGNIEEALEILSREAAAEPSGRGRFLRRLQQAQVCVSTANAEVARPLLEALAEEIAQRKLQEWEVADLVAQPLTLLYGCLDGSEDAAEQKRKLYAEICRLYPARAVRLPR